MHPTPKPPDIRDLIPLRRFAELVGVKPQTVSKWILLGKIGVVRGLGRPLIPRQEVERLIRAGWQPARNGGSR